ncbi:MAG: hypothetical protein ACD_62C00603G0003 [uncultured bacterium]|nr:MAG: hypothetical protein ACD_62C00603G0003 [uncultured bacterium]
MLKPHQNLGLIDEHVYKFLLVRPVGQDFFDGHVFLKTFHANEFGPVDGGHPALGNLAYDEVATKLLKRLFRLRLWHIIVTGPDIEGLFSHSDDSQ